MRIKITRILICFLVSQFIMGPVLAEDSYSRQWAGDSVNTGFGTSFRQTAKDDPSQFLNYPVQMGQRQGQGGMSRGAAMGMGMTDMGMGINYQVHILGEVKNPGTYRIAASDRLSEVLQRAGGVSNDGSTRNIEIRRQGEATKKVDVLAFQLFGNLNDNPYLLDNDVVFVPIRGPTINIVGAIKRPKDYELKNEKTLSDVIKLAGGTSVGAAMDKPINVVRFVDGKKEVLNIPPAGEEFLNFKIQNGDVVFVPHMITERNKFDFDLPKLPGDNIFYPSFEDRVFVLGGVGSPGAYTFNPYYTLPQYLSLAGGTTKMATNKITVLSPDGRSSKITKKNIKTIVVNPGDTVIVGERRIPPEGWLALTMSIAGFGLSTFATVLALTDRYK